MEDTVSTSYEIRQSVYDTWKAGDKVTLKDLENYGPGAFFVCGEIDDTIFNRINGVSFDESANIKREDLRYLRVIHYDGDESVRKGEIICNKKISDDLINIFRALFDARYPIESVKLIDDFNGDDVASMKANNTSCFNYRMTSGGGKLSKHSEGMAIDLNPLYNPYVKKNKGIILPPEAKIYTNRDSVFRYKIGPNDLAYKEFAKRGFKWGGNWRTLKDYQHFQK